MIKRQRHWVLFFLVTFIAMVLLAACGGGYSEETSGDAGGDTGSDSGEAVELSMLVSETAMDDPGFVAVLDAIEKDLNMKTNVEVRPGGPEGENVVKTRLATGDMADLVLFNSGSLLMALNPSQYFVDLSEEPFMDNVMDSYKEVVSSNDQVFGIPAKSSQVGAWLYNKKVYQELGLEVPRTWDELMANNEKIKEAGKTAVITTYGEAWTSQLPILADFYNVQAEVANFADDYTNGEAKFANTPEAQRGFERIQEIHEKGYQNEDYTVATYDQGMQMIAEGTGAHYPMLTQVLPIIEENYPDLVDDIGVFPQPSDDPETNGLTTWMPDAIMINKEAENVDAAKKWLDYFISDKGIAAYESKAKSIGPYVLKDVELPEDSYAAVEEMQVYFEEGNIAPALEFVSPIKGPNLPQICTSVGSGTMTAAEAAAMYDDDVEKQAKQLGLDWD
ncbi:extracellular solute-binding protein [Gracilibacillus caseinilyticus]|uniref:Extracellular solute-binding protein n=1 Tax=Gracilibacillus caseinilyticus TaxID=2932256 RepID=A0ABY4F2S3_9BACI|nr:extracellular solute-binding protein [Gracilibacillus caseinilyticus]UOQ50373.1 extracellular solute-binding protein [Gracilibacillus caseinilyticus]